MENLVIGMGLSGKSAAYYLLKKNERVLAVDKNFETLLQQKDVQQLLSLGLKLASEDSLINFDTIDRVIVSPGISLTHPLYKKALENHKIIEGEVELAAKELLEKKWIGITGTNGKTTVTLLIEHMLNCCNVKAKALGNVGKPICQVIEDIKDAFIIAELSSYQIETLHSKVIDLGLIMNITPDHLDRYANMEEYAKAKINMINALKRGGRIFVFEEVYNVYQSLFKDSSILTYGYLESNYVYTDSTDIFIEGKKVISLPECLRGKKSHEVENFLAAFIITYSLGLDPKDIKDSFSSFKKPAHRLELVFEANEIKFVDDSKGTNLDAVIKAVESFDEDIVLIAGGVHKGASYLPWKSSFSKKVRAIFTIGQAAPLIYDDLNQTVPVFICQTLDEAVLRASSFAQRGQVVLLSPGCSSFDMFKDYAHRGEEFKKSVFKLYTNKLKD
jgi:UDP-N-acetylmuramoylalanine--D-glutamate ligase